MEDALSNDLLHLLLDLHALGVRCIWWRSTEHVATVPGGHGLWSSALHFLNPQCDYDCKRRPACTFGIMPPGIKALFNIVTSSSHTRDRHAFGISYALLEHHAPGLLRELVRCHERRTIEALIKCAPNLKDLAFVRPLFLFSRSVHGKQE